MFRKQKSRFELAEVRESSYTIIKIQKNRCVHKNITTYYKNILNFCENKIKEKKIDLCCRRFIVIDFDFNRVCNQSQKKYFE